MDFPKKFVISYKNKPVPVYIVGDIQYLYFVVQTYAEGDIYLNVDFEEDGKMKWIEVSGVRTDRASEIGKNIQKQMEREGYRLDHLKI
jgi:hypothetical protein